MSGYVCIVDIDLFWEDVVMPDATSAEQAEEQCHRWIMSEYGPDVYAGIVQITAHPADDAGDDS